MMLTIFLFASLFNVAFAEEMQAQRDVMKQVNSLFAAMKTGDSTAVRQLFTEDAGLKTVFTREGESKIMITELQRFLEVIGTPHPTPFDERIYNVDIRIDGELAVVWAPYKFYLGDKLSHCGVNIFHLIRKGEKWLIFEIVDTRRTKNCD